MIESGRAYDIRIELIICREQRLLTSGSSKVCLYEDGVGTERSIPCSF